LSIASTLRQTKRPYYLVEIDFEGLTKRYSSIDISVPYSAGNPRLFRAGIKNEIEIGATFDLINYRYTMEDVLIEIANKGRLQDLEVSRSLDGSQGTIYLWTDGLDWSEIETDGVLFKGQFQKEYHDANTYSFRLIDHSASRVNRIPTTTINTDTWASHRTAGGGGSMAGRAQPLVFGDWSKGVPLLCVNTASFIYLVCTGKSKSVDGDYTATTENIYDKNGSVIGAVNYTFYPSGLDGEGNVVTQATFIGDQIANEPITCSLRAILDGAGDITGTIDTLIEHPADILYYLLKYYSSLDPSEIHLQSIKTMRALYPSLRFTTMINTQADGVDILNRILSQCQCARIPRGNGIGIMVLQPDSLPNIGRIEDKLHIQKGSAKISKTPADLICNDLRVIYGPNPGTRTFEKSIVYDRVNDMDCRDSFYDYGAYPQRELQLTDVWDDGTAVVLAKRYIKLNAFRHDIVECEVPIWEGFDILEGDRALLTMEEGPSHDGTGWTDEPCILIERRFKQATLYQKWWRIAAV